MIQAEQILSVGVEQIRMLSDCVLVRLRGKYDDYTGPLAMPASHSKDPNDAGRGVVVAVGPGYYPEKRLAPHRPEQDTDRGDGTPQGTELSPVVHSSRRVPMSVKPGDEVVLDSALAGDSIIIDNREHRIVRESEIAGVVES